MKKKHKNKKNKIAAQTDYAPVREFDFSIFEDEQRLMSVFWDWWGSELSFTKEGYRYLKEEYGLDRAVDLVIKNGGFDSPVFSDREKIRASFEGITENELIEVNNV